MTEPFKANEPHFLIAVEGVDAPLRVTRFRGEEGLSRLFHFTIQLESDDTGIKPENAVGQKASFFIHWQGHERTIGGIISRFEFRGIDRHAGVYSADLDPDVYLLSQIYQCRIFQNMSPIDILKDVIESAGIPNDFVCSGDYQPLEYCVQYRESDFDFFSRLAERFGIFYFFEFTDSGTKLVVGDSQDVHPPINGPEEIRFHIPGGLTEYEDVVFEFRTAHFLRPTKHTFRDYNFKSPHLDLTSDCTGELPNDLESYDYPGDYDSQDVGSAIALVRMEAEECARFNGSGTSNSVRLSPGSTFTLANHPSVNLNSSYLVTGTVHSGSQPTPDSASYGELGYSNEFRIQPAGLPFRPQLRAPKPVVEGSQTATVSGPDGHEVYSDEFNRIKVRFHWDRSGSPNDQSSCWVRVSQTWAGKGWGSVFIPRIGQEVIVDFLEGDPDRPIITGCVYNGLNMPPYPLPDKQTVSTIRSNSSLGGDGFNEYRFEDEKGSEEIYQHAQRDLTIATENDKNQTTGNNETLDIGKDRTKTVGANEQSNIEGNRTESVGKDETISVDGNRSISITKEESLSVGKGRSVSVDKDQAVSVGKNSTFDVAENSTVSIGKDLSESVGKSQSVTVGQDLKISIDKKCGIAAGDSVLISSDKDITLKCGSAEMVLKNNGDISINGKKISIKGSGEVNIKGSKVTNN
jgi:type VI secretion system secreted protein VgrG